MVDYEAHKESAGQYLSIVSSMLEKIGRKQYKDENHYPPNATLPDSQESDYTIQTPHFEAVLEVPDCTVQNIIHTESEMSVTRSQVTANPGEFTQITNDLYDDWLEIIGDPRKQTSVYEYAVEREVSLDLVETLGQQYELLSANPTLQDFVEMIQDNSYRLVVDVLDLEIDPEELMNPALGHELTPLFLNGDIKTVYSDSDLVLLKPEYPADVNEIIAEKEERRVARGEVPNSAVGRELLEQGRRRGAFRIRVNVTEIELAYVVGIDDTPTGLFVHSVDGTNLELNQSVTREMIHDAMNFDRSYNGEESLLFSEGERIRLQGDMAMECLELHREWDEEQSDCNIPIDNHLPIIENCTVAPESSRETEPVVVEVTAWSNILLVHDEHDTVKTEIPPGFYRLYLLDRGPQPEDRRPLWR